MRLSIKYKLFFAILSAHIIVYVAMYSIGRYNFDRGFLEYVSRIEERQVPALVNGLQTYYEHTGSWEPIRANPGKWASLIRESIQNSDENPPPIQPEEIRHSPRGISPNDWYYSSEYSPARPYLLLLDRDKSIIHGNSRALGLATLNEIVARGEVVGYLAVTSRQELSEQADLLFTEQQKQSFFLFAIILVFISALIAFPMSSILVRPVRNLVEGTRALTNGDYSSRISEEGSDELARLSKDFNVLANTLEQNQQARQLWIADISHELRTPLAILRGELEAIQDGVRQLTPEVLDSLHFEVGHLNTLVNDLHELSMSDIGALIYKKEKINLVENLEQSLDMHKQQLAECDLDYRLDIKSAGNGRAISILADSSRLAQLFSNLIQNSCRYTEKGGKLNIAVKETADEIIITWADSAPGVDDTDLEKLFDRLYRVDSSRNRKKGGSGLGLTICKNIVEAHEGNISADHSELGGLKITIRLRKKH